MARVSNELIDKRKAALLGHLVVLGGLEKDGFVVASHKEFTNNLGLSISELRTVLRALHRDHLVEVFPRRLPNGGQLANAYRPTEDGLHFLEARVPAASASVERGAQCPR